jgi:hypothetical protein
MNTAASGAQVLSRCHCQCSDERGRRGHRDAGGPVQPGLLRSESLGLTGRLEHRSSYSVRDGPGAGVWQCGRGPRARPPVNGGHGHGGNSSLALSAAGGLDQVLVLDS